MKCWRNEKIDCEDMPDPDGYVCENECQKWNDEGEVSPVSSMIYKNVQYNVNDIVKLNQIDGITNPSGTIVISGIAPPDTIALREVGTSWVGSCNIEEIKVIGKLEEDIQPIEGDIGPVTNIIITGEPGLGMSYLAHTGAEVVSGTSCKECGRPLSAPRSVACGYGPVCYAKVFGVPQPLTETERLKKQARGSRRSSRKVFEIDYSKLTDARTVFE